LSRGAKDFFAEAEGLRCWLLPSILVEVPRQFGVRQKGPSDPPGRLRTTPGFAMVAAMMSGSWLSFGRTLMEKIAVGAPLA
jgi:hypothetical protein